MPRTKKFTREQLEPRLLPDIPRGIVAPPIIWSELFGNDHPVELEIGFGKGLFLTTSATANPSVNYFGVEIERKYQLYAATRLLERGLKNVCLACGDGRDILRDRVSPHSVRTVHVYFPDPWWKTKHRKRRVFTPEFATAAGNVLKVGGRLSIATDVEAYHGVMVQIVRSMGKSFLELRDPSLEEVTDGIEHVTSFERKFRNQGRPIYRAIFERTDSPMPSETISVPELARPFVEYRPLMTTDE